MRKSLIVAPPCAFFPSCILNLSCAFYLVPCPFTLGLVFAPLFNQTILKPYSITYFFIATTLKANELNFNNVDILTNEATWQQSRADIFWGEIAPCDHVVQIYENDNVFIDSLAGFVGGGISAGDSCIVIATQAHLKALEKRLTDFGVHPESLKDDRYFPLDAEETLSKFMVDGWPNEKLFNETVSSVLSKAGFRKRRIRAFGEMVALLWAQGLNGATVQLEHLWNKFCEEKSFCLFCAYPKSGFTEDINNSFAKICCAHTKMIDGSRKQIAQIIYKDILPSEAV